MIDALVGGHLVGAPVERAAKNGNRFATAKIRVTTREGETLYSNVITFSATAVEALLALGDGDSIAIAGELTPKVWTTASGEARAVVDVLAHAVLSPYDVSRRRKASSSSTRRAAATDTDDAALNDELPPL